MPSARTNFIKALMEDKSNLEKKLQDEAHSTIESLLSETVNNSLRHILAESDDEKDDGSFAEEEVTADGENVTDDKDATKPEGEEGDAEKDGDKSADIKAEPTETPEDLEGGEGDGAAEDDLWSNLEQYKDADGEYDLSSMDKDNLIKVLRVMKPEDGVRVVKNDNGTVTLSDDETDKEYVIDIDGAIDVDDYDSDDADIDIDLDLGESVNNECNEDANLGYTDNYQKQTAMTTPSNHEPANSKTTYSMDGGVPQGIEKPYAGKGDNAPYNNNVNEGEEDDINETMTTQENGAYNRGTGMVHTNTNYKAAKGRNAREGGRQIHGTGDNSYSDAQLESIKRKANEIFLENKQLKAILPKMTSQLKEAVILVHSYGNIIRLMNENSTTKDEKKDIVNRFSEVKTREESDKLYSTITEEFKRNHKTIVNIDNNIAATLDENRTHSNEKPMYESTDLSQQLDLISRMESLYKK